MQDQGQGSIPAQKIYVDCLSCANQAGGGHHGKDCRQTGESGENPFRAG